MAAASDKNCCAARGRGTVPMPDGFVNSDFGV